MPPAYDPRLCPLISLFTEVTLPLTPQLLILFPTLLSEIFFATSTPATPTRIPTSYLPFISAFFTFKSDISAPFMKLKRPILCESGLSMVRLDIVNPPPSKLPSNGFSFEPIPENDTPFMSMFPVSLYFFVRSVLLSVSATRSSAVFIGMKSFSVVSFPFIIRSQDGASNKFCVIPWYQRIRSPSLTSLSEADTFDSLSLTVNIQPSGVPINTNP